MSNQHINGMVVAPGGDHAIMIDPENGHFGWTFWRHPDGQWVSARKATDVEMRAATDFAKHTGQSLHAAAPVPPAGDVEVLTHKQIREKRYAEDQAFHSWAFNKQGAAIGRMNGQVAGLEAWHARGEIADVEVTRLTAEVDRWHDLCVERTTERDEARRQVQLLNEAGEFLDDVSQGVEDQLRAKNAALQSELTKARELLTRISNNRNYPIGWATQDDVSAFLATPIAHNANESCGQDAEAAKGGE